ncbi:MAG TPA: serine hydrolase domain-containing protein [Thermoanaerobaculia bacterium]|nr:serine hydrolase domain-containing protein [Thermoanaerobaculia bacterium]
MELDDFLRREIDLGSFASAAYAIGTSAGLEREGASGNAVSVPLRLPATPDTIYDCASITKPLVTGMLVLQAVAEGRIALDDEYRGFTYRELLTHTSGLRSWMPLYAYDDYLQAIEQDGREFARGERAVYSDLNFVLLYYALQEIFGDYVRAARERIFEPLQLQDACFHPPASLKPRIAATEWGQRFEPVLRQRLGLNVPMRPDLRQSLMWGETNDGNSFYAGGTCGNAGLFATARDVFRIAQGFVRGELAPREWVAEATRAHFEDRGLAWQLAGPGLSSFSFGHMGFTGTSVWVDGDRIMVLLTNRIHPCAAPIGMHRIRGEFHRLCVR